MEIQHPAICFRQISPTPNIPSHAFDTVTVPWVCSSVCQEMLRSHLVADHRQGTFRTLGKKLEHVSFLAWRPVGPQRGSISIDFIEKSEKSQFGTLRALVVTFIVLHPIWDNLLVHTKVQETESFTDSGIGGSSKKSEQKSRTQETPSSWRMVQEASQFPKQEQKQNSNKQCHESHR